MPEFTASIACGYATNVQWHSLGDFRALTGHYSAPSAASHWINTQMPILIWYNVNGADQAVYTETAVTGGALQLHFSGIANGATGVFLILGK
jgi:hypothetical protein